MAQATQQFVPIKDIRDSVVILKDGSMRGVLLCQAINLDLKSADEQTAIILQFQNFLNSLEFSLEIVASSRRLDIRPYLLKLEDRLQTVEGDLLRIQTREYIQFIQKFNEEFDVMSKYFYVVVPYSGASINITSAKSGIFSSLSGLFGKGSSSGAMSSAQFEEARSQLEQRLAVVMGGLESLSIETDLLKTAALIELYQKTFNPGELHSAAGALSS